MHKKLFFIHSYYLTLKRKTVDKT